MIVGLWPLVCLWATVLGSWTSLTLVLVTPWRRTLVGRMLCGYIAVAAVWWSLILVGSYAGVPNGVPRPLQLAEAAAFTGIPLAVLWMVALQIRARWHHGAPEDAPEAP